MAALRRYYDAIRRRIVAGLILALPIAITFWILYQLYITLSTCILDPIFLAAGDLLDRTGLTAFGFPAWMDRGVVPLISVVSVLVILDFLALFARSRLHRTIDWVL